jgi:hypothetical protein
MSMLSGLFTDKEKGSSAMEMVAQNGRGGVSKTIDSDRVVTGLQGSNLPILN